MQLYSGNLWEFCNVEDGDKSPDADMSCLEFGKDDIWVPEVAFTVNLRSIGVSRLAAEEEDDGKVNDDEIEPPPEVTDLDDPLQAAIALNVISHTMLIDDAAILNTKRDDFIGGAEEQQLCRHAQSPPGTRRRSNANLAAL
ncbi:hypothetical protein HPB50_019135 [Hyalomma asiaticum]|uniref:Uncharacterized protein n=1 Tax=Hyalomma asiaticum TaxID=266040 RepID=A0ACB7SGE4_HYAAI|nr:hypothetical protein HPB50_019135 [Hyalomma asiaticum]